MGHNTIDNSWNRTWNYSTRIVDSVTHGVTATYFDRNGILFHQFCEFQTEWNYITVDVRAGNIFQMASWADSGLQTFPDDTEIMFHRLFSGHFHFIKNMIIGTADKNSGFFQTDIFYQFKVFFACTNPAGYFREFVTSFQTFINGIPVFFAVQEKFTLADLSGRTAQLMKIIINRNNLFGTVGSS